MALDKEKLFVQPIDSSVVALDGTFNSGKGLFCKIVEILLWMDAILSYYHQPNTCWFEMLAARERCSAAACARVIIKSKRPFLLALI